MAVHLVLIYFFIWNREALLLFGLNRSLFQLAGLAHLVERHLAKVEVASSSLVARSIKEEVIVYDSLFFF